MVVRRRDEYKNFNNATLAGSLKKEKARRNKYCQDTFGKDYEYDPSIEVYKNFKTVYTLERERPFSDEDCVQTKEYDIDKSTDKFKRYYPNIRNEYQCSVVKGQWNPKALNRSNNIDDGVCFVRASDKQCSRHDNEDILKARFKGKKSFTSIEFKTAMKCLNDKACEWLDEQGECASREAMDYIYEITVPKIPSQWPRDITRDGFQQYLEDYYNRLLDTKPQKHMEPIGTGNRCTSHQKFMISKPQTVVNMVFKAMAANPATTNRGLLVFHGVGSGKTCTAAGIMEAFWDNKDFNIVFMSSVEGLASNTVDEFIRCAALLFPRFKVMGEGLSRDEHIAKVKTEFEIRGVRFFTFAQMAHFLLIANPLKVKPEMQDFHRNFLRNSVLIIDEVHNIFKPLPHQRYEHTALKEFLTNVNNPAVENMKLAVLTATPGDEPQDVVELLNFVRDKRAPEIKVPNIDNPKSVKDFADDIRGLISYFDIASDMSKYPRVIKKDPYIAPMHMKQYAKYVEVFKEVKADEKNLEKLRKEDKLEKYYKGPRRYSNMLFNLEEKMHIREFSNKLPLLIENIKMYPNDKHYIYSTFFENRGYGGHGILAIAKVLEKELKYTKMSHKDARALNAADKLPTKKKRYMLAITNELTENKQHTVGKNLKQLTTLYNHPENNHGEYVQLFLASQKFNEGVDFKGIRHIHIFEPFLSFNKEQQTIGRGARYCSHRDLNIENGEWTVTVHKYLADFPIEAKEIDLPKLRASIETSKKNIKEDEDRLEALKGKRGTEITKQRNEIKAAIQKQKKELLDVGKRLKGLEVLDTEKYFMIDQKIESDVQEKVKKMSIMYGLMKSSAVDCKLFKSFHAQSGDKFRCVE
jgi:superfamily II DNA or RNA helicase